MAGHGLSTKPLSKDKKRAAVELWLAGVPLAKIRKQLVIPESTLRKILAYAKKNPDNPIQERKNGSGRPPKVRPPTLAVMKRMLVKTPTLMARCLKKKVPELANTPIRTIQHHCQKTLLLPARKMAQKPLLTERMMKQRLEFAQQYQDWTVEDWKKVMFSDESHFELGFRGNRRQLCRREKGSDRFAVEFTKKTVKHPPKIMVWGCFSWRGRGAIEFMKKGEMMNGKRYLELLEDKLERFMELHQTTHFLQDSAPCHKAKIVTAWFTARPNITLIKWPGNSPDLNPIENCWSWMKNQLSESTSATSLETWKREILQLWVTRMDDSQYLRSLVDSMPRRMQEVIEKAGGMTKY